MLKLIFILVFSWLEYFSVNLGSNLFFLDINGKPFIFFCIREVLFHFSDEFFGQWGSFIVEIFLIYFVCIRKFFSKVVSLKLSLLYFLPIHDNTFDFKFWFWDLNSLMIKLVGCIIVQKNKIEWRSRQQRWLFVLFSRGICKFFMF